MHPFFDGKDGFVKSSDSVTVGDFNKLSAEFVLSRGLESFFP